MLPLDARIQTWSDGWTIAAKDHEYLKKPGAISNLRDGGMGPSIAPNPQEPNCQIELSCLIFKFLGIPLKRVAYTINSSGAIGTQAGQIINLSDVLVDLFNHFGLFLCCRCHTGVHFYRLFLAQLTGGLTEKCALRLCSCQTVSRGTWFRQLPSGLYRLYRESH